MTRNHAPSIAFLIPEGMGAPLNPWRRREVAVLAVLALYGLGMSSSRDCVYVQQEKIASGLRERHCAHCAGPHPLTPPQTLARTS